MFVTHKIEYGATHLRPSPARLRIVSPRKSAQRGQTIVIALLVLILLAFSGALFITIVTHNLQNARHAQVVSNVDYYAEAGLRFADQQLTYGPDGADWRPPIITTPADPRDPDATLLQQRFSRYNFGKGRFLIRVTYQPVLTTVNGATAGDPLARYIKIESIGRDGTVDPTDPTTFQHGPAQPLNRTLVGYKAIGITDFARFETNPDNRSDVMNIGVASVNHGNTYSKITTPGVADFGQNQTSTPDFPILTQLGAPDAYLLSNGALLPNPNAGMNLAPPNGTTREPGGGSFFANGSVRFYGENQIFLSRPSTPSGPIIPSLDESVQASGTILLDSFDPSQGSTYAAAATGAQSTAVQLMVNNSAVIAPTMPYLVTPSSPDNTLFDTFQGAVRDGATGNELNDQNGFPRSVHRLEPPQMDATDPTSYLPRYKVLAFDSQVRTGVGSANSRQGYGKTIYIDNFNDIQPESSVLTGGATLVDDWLHRTQANWTADFYNPPGADLDFRPRTVTVSGNTYVEPSVAITRNDVDSNGSPYQWVSPVDGKTPNGSTMVVYFPDCLAGPSANRDIVIYAEGNVRIHGIVSLVSAIASNPGNPPAGANDPWHVTIVTNGTAYIDGNLLKGNPRSSIAVLAHDYVCVNTTQFFAGKQSDATQDPSGNPVTPPTTPSGSTDTPGISLDPNNPSEELVQEFFFGLTNAGTPAKSYGAGQLYLYVSGAADGDGPAQPKFSLWNSAGVYTDIPSPMFATSSNGGSVLTHITLPVSNLDNVSSDQIVTLGSSAKTDPNGVARSNFLLNRVAVLPNDVRIEAVLFAQTKSFFVIPGPWFNSDKSDTIDQFLNQQGATAHNTATSDAQRRFPFFGQPTDFKVTIYGSVCEARPADISAQTEWMRHWGWIPQFHGSLFTERNDHPTPNNTPNTPDTGLTIIYDPMAAYPYSAVSPPASGFLRVDAYGNPLPFAPKLPVCAGLLYTGESSAQSLFQ